MECFWRLHLMIVVVVLLRLVLGTDFALFFVSLVELRPVLGIILLLYLHSLSRPALGTDFGLIFVSFVQV